MNYKFSMRNGKALTGLRWICTICLVGFGIYFFGLTIPYYGDDFKFVFDIPSSKILYFFLHPNPHAVWYRPIEASFLALVQTYFGLNTLPIHIVQLLLHILFAWMIFKAALVLGFSKLQAMCSSAYMVISQSNVLAVLSNDTFSQLLGTLFGCLALWFLFLSTQSSNAPMTDQFVRHNRYFALSVIAFSVSIFSKESSLGFLLSIVIVVLFNMKKPSSFSFRKIFAAILPFLAVTLVYVALRSLIIKVEPADRYDIAIGLNILKNFGMLVFATVVPASTVSIVEGLAESRFLILVIIVGATLLFIGMALYGLGLSPGRERSLLVSALGLTSAFPMILMKHVSELYTYNLIPFISILVGVGVGFLLRKLRAHKSKIAIIIIFVTVISMGHVLGIQTKAHLMKRNGDRASSLLVQIGSYLTRVPPNGKLFLINPPMNQTEYSVFLMKGFNVLSYGLHRINQMSGRKDFTVRIIEIRDYEALKFSDNSLFLSLDDGTVREYKGHIEK